MILDQDTWTNMARGKTGSLSAWEGPGATACPASEDTEAGAPVSRLSQDTALPQLNYTVN